jgi:hypothetical protein
MLPITGNGLGPGGWRRSFAAPSWPKIAFLATTVAINVVINIARVISPGVHRDAKSPAAKSVDRNALVNMPFVAIAMVDQEMRAANFVANLNVGQAQSKKSSRPLETCEATDLCHDAIIVAVSKESSPTPNSL